jgi:hypothetical protein
MQKVKQPHRYCGDTDVQREAKLHALLANAKRPSREVFDASMAVRPIIDYLVQQGMLNEQGKAVSFSLTVAGCGFIAWLATRDRLFAQEVLDCCIGMMRV